MAVPSKRLRKALLRLPDIHKRLFRRETESEVLMSFEESEVVAMMIREKECVFLSDDVEIAMSICEGVGLVSVVSMLDKTHGFISSGYNLIVSLA